MMYYNVRGKKDPANRPNASDSMTLTTSEDRESAYSDAELQRIEETLGARARRSAVHRFDLEQMHLSEFTTTEERNRSGRPTNTAEASA